MQIACQNNSIDRLVNTQERNNEIYPVSYKDDGVNKTATYYSVLNKSDIKGRVELNLPPDEKYQGSSFRILYAIR